MAIETRNSRPENLNIEKFKLKDGSEIIFIKGYGKSYGVSVDKYKNIYIPSFDKGFLYKILPNLKDYEIYDIKENKLIKISENESPSYKKGGFIQPHDITFDNLNNLYITEMGHGMGKLRGQVKKFSEDNKLIAKIGIDANNGNGLDGPTVSHFTEDGYVYVSEWRANKVLKYNKSYNLEKTFGKVNYDKDNVAHRQSVVSSVGVRLLFTTNSWQIIKENALLGAGTGDFPSEYKKTSVRRSPMGPYATNPHNMYVLVLVQSGIVGLLSMLSIMYYQIKLSFKESNRFFGDVGFALPILFLIIMLSDSYLLGHYTGLLFVFFSSFLYKGFDKS